MNVRQTKLALRIITAVLAVAALFSLVIGLASPLATPDVSSPNQTPGPAKEHASRLPSIASYSPIFAHSLQGSTNGMATGVAPGQAETQSPEPLVPISQLSLVGTIGNSVALIKGPDGTVGMVETGEDVNGAPVLAIRPSECDLRINGKLMTLRILPPPDNSAIVPSR